MCNMCGKLVNNNQSNEVAVSYYMSTWTWDTSYTKHLSSIFENSCQYTWTLNPLEHLELDLKLDFHGQDLHSYSRNAIRMAKHSEYADSTLYVFNALLPCLQFIKVPLPCVLVCVCFFPASLFKPFLSCFQNAHPTYESRHVCIYAYKILVLLQRLLFNGNLQLFS